MLLLGKSPLVWTLVLLLGPRCISALGTIDVESIIKDTVLSWLLPGNNSSDHSNSCYKDLSEVVWGLYRKEEWALKMLDAAGKPEAGILYGNVLGWAGSYEQCLGIRSGSIQGQHCWLEIKLGNIINIKEVPEKFKIPLIGICLPNSCKNEHFQPVNNYARELINNAISLISINASLALSIDCEYRNIEMNVTSLIAITIYTVLLLFVLLGTFVDIQRSAKLKKNGRRNNENTRCAAFTRFLLHFSLYSNCKKLFRLPDEKTSDLTFGQLDALRVVGTAMVISIHTLDLLPLYNTKEPMAVAKDQGHWLILFTNQLYSMDMFFLVTGFLTLHGILRKPLKDQRNKYRFVFSYIFNRYLRLSLVPLTIVLVTRHAFTSYLSSGPYWIPIDSNCQSQWWEKALLVNNFSMLSDGCFGLWWFLSAAMQLHLFSLLIVIPFINRKYRLCVVSGSAMIIISWCWVCQKSYQLDAPPLFMQRINLKESVTYMRGRYHFLTSIYPTAIYHVGPYLVGMALAWALFQRKDGITLTKKRVCLGWTFSSILYFFTLYGVYLRPNRMWKSVHTALATTAHGLFIAWLILICYTKNRGIVSSVLRWKYWSPLSKLGLSAYLVHLTVIEFFYYSVVDKINYSLPLLFIYFLRHWAITYPLAILTTLTIEMPLSAILDRILKG